MASVSADASFLMTGVLVMQTSESDGTSANPLTATVR